MPSDRHSVMHVIPDPYYGVRTNACFTIRDDLSRLLTTDVVLLSDLSNAEGRDWRAAVEAIRTRASSLRIYGSADDVPEDLCDTASVLFGIEYDPELCRRSDGSSVLGPPDGPRRVLWDILVPYGGEASGNEVRESALNAVPGGGSLCPMIISGRLKSVAGIKSRRTVGVVFSPFHDVAFAASADLVASSAARAAGPGGRVIASDSASHFPLPAAEAIAEERGVELARCRWCPGHEWKVGAVCDVVVAPLPSDGGFPFVLATCMAEGRACIGAYDGDSPPECFAEDSVNSLLCGLGDADGLASRARWLLDNPGKARALATNAQIGAYFYDKDFCLPRLRRDLFG